VAHPSFRNPEVTVVALIESANSKLVSQLEGVHLFGFDGAPCSQRVSFALAEKGLHRARRVAWRSEAPPHLVAAPGTYVFRNVSLVTHENLTEDYAKIQPNMVVPALVHDGRLHIESMEIIEYLDAAWPESPLTPVDPEEARRCGEIVTKGKELHVAVRHVTFHWTLGRLGKTDRKTQDLVATLEPGSSRERLAAFYANFNRTGIETETFVEHLHALEAGYSEQNAILESDGREFLAGPRFSTADIIWAIKVLRLTECGYPFARNFPALSAWYDRIKRRRGFKDGVLSRNRVFHHVFRLKSGWDRLIGRGIANHAAGSAI
jgi:glutathione S-transferase